MMGSRIQSPAVDFACHNEEVRRVWGSYNAGRPIRVPLGNFTLEPRIWIQDPRLNTSGVTWESFTNDPEVMFTTLLRYSHHVAHHIPHDIEMGVPEKHWEIGAYFSNVAEGAWLGSPVHFPDNQVPSFSPVYVGERKEEILERGVPGPFDGFMAKVLEYHEYFVDRARGYEFCGRPVKIAPPNVVLYSGGPLTIALGVCGSGLLEDMLVNEDHFHRVMDLVTTATIARMQAWRSYLGLDPVPQTMHFADDSIQLLSVRSYRENVLPYHRRILSALAHRGAHCMHLCGNVQRHFPTLVRELGVKGFDTGYPINFATLRDEVGDDVEIWGGVPVANLLSDTPDQIYACSASILKSGIMRGGKFVLKEANNLPPLTPPESLAAMYRAVREVGLYGQ